MKFMKIITLLLSIFALCPLCAQTLEEPFSGSEPFRSRIVPYHTAQAAAAGDATASTYVAKLAEWSTSEDGREYDSSFAVPVWWLNRQIIVRVGRVSSSYEVLVGGKSVGFVGSGAVPVEFNVTKAVVEGRNTLQIRLTDTPLNSVGVTSAPFKVDTAAVEVVCQPTIRVRDIFCSTDINDAGAGVVEFGVVMKCDALNAKTSRIGYQVKDGASAVLVRGYKDITLDMRREDTLRFAARVPQEVLWSKKSPALVTVEIENVIDNRPAEYICQTMGLRAVDVQPGKLFVNHLLERLSFVDYDASKPLQEQLTETKNGIILPVWHATDSLLTECDKAGIMVFVRAAISTNTLGDNIRIGGNPSNDPQWINSYLTINRAAYFTTRHHPCVVGYILAEGTTSGTNIYDTYLMLKSLNPRQAVVYEGANGEWCSDTVPFR